MIKVFVLFFVFFGCLSQSFAQMPVSKEATIIEVVSSAEVYMEGVGIYRSDKKSRRKRKKDVRKVGVQQAMEDAKRAAIHFLLYNGTDPLLKSNEEIDRFSTIQADFFNPDTISELIVFSQAAPNKSVSLDDGEGVKVFLKLKVNTDFLRQLLEENLVIFSKQELVSELGYPQIMVLPVGDNNQSPLQLLTDSKNDQHAAGVVESYLTAKLYDVIIPSQLDDINQMVGAIKQVKNIKQDAVYQLALSIGSDIYLEYSIGQSKSAYDTDQMAVTLRAYETTTGRLLATQTGYSKPRVGELFLSIEEALLSALGSVEQRILKYWEEDLNRGVQYKVIATVVGENISDDKLETLQDDFFDSIDDVAMITKENIVTESTFDLSIWCDSEKYPNARKLYKALANSFEDKQRKFTLKQVNRNRKLLILEIK